MARSIQELSMMVDGVGNIESHVIEKWCNGELEFFGSPLNIFYRKINNDVVEYYGRQLENINHSLRIVQRRDEHGFIKVDGTKFFNPEHKVWFSREDYLTYSTFIRNNELKEGAGTYGIAFIHIDGLTDTWNDAIMAEVPMLVKCLVRPSDTFKHNVGEGSVINKWLHNDGMDGKGIAYGIINIVGDVARAFNVREKIN